MDRPRKRRKDAKLAVCGAPTKAGTPCTRSAGYGTAHLYEGRCFDHEAIGNDLSRPIKVNPIQAVTGIMFSAAGEVAYAHGKVAALAESELIDKKGRRNPWLTFKHDAQERLAKFAKVAADMGIARDQVNIARAQTALMGEFMQAVLDRIDLTAAQREQIGPAIRAELATVAERVGDPEGQVGS